MEPTRNTNSSARTLELPEALDFTAAAPLAESFLKFVGEDLVVDAAKVQRLGASCLQVLLAAATTWKAEGNSLALAQSSPRFIEDLRLLGFAPEAIMNGARRQ